MVEGTNKITGYNQRFAELWKIPRNLLVTDDDLPVLQHVTRQLKNPEAFLARVRRLYDQPEEESFDVLELADGRTFERLSRPQRIEGRPVGRVWSFRDITERKHAEERLQESEERFRDLFENANDLIQIISPEGRILYVNRSWRETLGYSEKEIQGLSVSDIIDSTCGEYCNATFEKVLAEGSVNDVKTIFIARDGGKVFLEGSGRCKYEGGKPESVRCMFRDVTFRKKAEEERAKLEAQLLQAQKMEAVGQLAGGIAHDFNNILTAIVGYGHILHMKMKSDDVLRVYIEQILESADRAASLTQNLLAFSRKQIMNARLVDLSKIIKQVEGFLLRIIGEDIEVKTKLSKDLLTVKADTAQIEQALLNLAINARDAMPQGGVLSIETDSSVMDNGFIKAHGFGEAGKYALISVTDTGVGMDKATSDKIFEPFFTTKEVGKGTGLGLAMVYGTVKQHNGFITVYSEPGKGTTFRIYMPLFMLKAKEEPEAAQLSLLVGGTETILVAEDEPVLRKLNAEILTEYGYSIILAEDGEDAINKFIENKDRVQLCILDMIMPKKSGKEVFEVIQEIRPETKVLFTSGYPAGRIHMEKLLEKGFLLIQKPISPMDLLKKVRGILDS